MYSFGGSLAVRVLNEVVSAVAPRRCAGCDHPGAPVICDGCVAALQRLRQPARRSGGAGSIRAAYPFEEPARRIIHRAKYSGERRALHHLSELAAVRVCDPLGATPALVIPVPLGRRRRRARGFNQAEVIAAVLAAEIGAPVSLKLVRSRETAPQVGGDESVRGANVEGAFEWSGGPLAGAAVWLVDDVLTTGATTAAAAAALEAAGVGRVDVGVVALVL